MNECLSFIASCTFHCLALLLLYAALFIVLSSVLFIVYVCCLVEWKTPLSDGISARRVLVITARDRFGRPARAGVPFQVAKKESTNTSTESKEIKELVPVDMKVQDDMLFHVTVESLGSYACFFFSTFRVLFTFEKNKADALSILSLYFAFASICMYLHFFMPFFSYKGIPSYGPAVRAETKKETVAVEDMSPDLRFAQ